MEESINIQQEAEGLANCLLTGDATASVHLARLIEADTKGALYAFAEVLCARLCDHLDRLAEMGVYDSRTALDETVYTILKIAAVDWDKIPRPGRPGEES